MVALDAAQRHFGEDRAQKAPLSSDECAAICSAAAIPRRDGEPVENRRAAELRGPAIMAQTGHRSLPRVRRYIRLGTLFSDNAAAAITL
jgi:hypothetical protein